MDEKKMYDIKEALKIIPLSKSGLYKACSDGKIPVRRIGASSSPRNSKRKSTVRRHKKI